MNEITSINNQFIKDIVKLQQKKYRDDLIIFEGEKALNGAIESGIEIKHIISADKNILDKYSKYDTYFVNDKIMKKIATTQSPPVVFASCKKPSYNTDEFKKYKKIVLIDDIKDSGNLGTIIRSAAAFGIEGIMLYGSCTDEYSPKTIRAAAGNMFKMPIIKIDYKKLAEFKNTHKFVATVVNNKNNRAVLTDSEYIIVMIGSEAKGLCKELLNIKDADVTLPMKNNVESLNISVAASIIFYIMQNI